MPTIHLVPHTHWDREWYLPFQSFRMKLVHFIDNLLDFLDSDPSLTHFTLDGQTILLEDYLEVQPEREADLIRHIRTGRLLIGPWYILADEFIVSPEAIVRNLLRGNTACGRFGARMEIGYIPDTFGHIGQMPQILQGFGIETAAFRRGLSDEPCEIWWQAPGGARVLAAYLRDGYDNAARLPTDASAFEAFIQERRDSLLPHAATSHLLLLNGTDHQELQPEVTRLVAGVHLEEDSLFISTLPTYLSAVREEIDSRNLTLPTIHGELRDPKRHHLLAGVLSSRVWIKQRNHACETLLERWAEPFAAWTEIIRKETHDRVTWTGHLSTPRVRRPSALIGEAWRLLLQCQPHDSICGCSVDQVHEEMQVRFDQSEQIGEEITRQSLASLVEALATIQLGNGNNRMALVVFNPDAQARSDMAEANLELPAGLDPFEIVDDRNNPIAYRILERRARSLADMELDAEGLQSMLAVVKDGRVLGLSLQTVAIVHHIDHALIDIVLAEAAEPNTKAVQKGIKEVKALLTENQISKFRVVSRFASEVKLELVAPEVPGHGYRTFGLRPTTQALEPVIEDESLHIGNDVLRVETNSNGTLTLTDRQNDAVYPGLLLFGDLADCGDSYTFCPVEGDTPIDSTNAKAKIRRSFDRCGQTLEIDLHLQLPIGLSEDRSSRSSTTAEMPIKVLARLTDGIPRVDLEIHLENTACDHRLQVLFPLPFKVIKADYDGHFEIIHRPTALPPAELDWAEQPVKEKPMRSFVAASQDAQGLMIATRGIREASVSPQGVIAITLLRSFGWLSRNDLATRKGGAGPNLPTPKGQALGKHIFHLSLIPFDGNVLQARLQAQAFQSKMKAVGSALHDGILPASGSLLSIDNPSFDLTAVKKAEDGRGLVVRGVNLAHKPTDIQLTSMLPLQSASRTRMDETSLHELQVESGHILNIRLQPLEILTLRLDPVGSDDQE
jgi:alpha-mannosidase